MKALKKFFSNWSGPETAFLLIVLLLMSTLFFSYHVYKNNKSNNQLKVYPCYCMMHKTYCPNGIIDPCEYQFFVEDTTISVYNNERYVGNIRLDGTLDSLITADNE